MDMQKHPGGRPRKEDARRCVASIRVNEGEKKTIMDAINKYGTAVAVGVILGAISQLEHDRKTAQK